MNEIIRDFSLGGPVYESGHFYAKTSAGKIKVWSAIVHNNNHNGTAMLEFSYGLKNGTMQTNFKEINKGKNIGRSNETTAFEQALKICKSKIKEKEDKGYFRSEEDIKETILPMLAHPFNKRKHNIKYPAHVQPKIDGIRMIAHFNNGKIKTFTRKGKEFTEMPHIEKELEFFFKRLKLPITSKFENIYIDGELYSNTLKFEELAGAVRRSDCSDSILSQISYHVFDMFDLDNKDWTFSNRIKVLMNNKTLYSGLKFIKPVRTFIIKNENGFRFFNSSFCIPNGYEGAMIRNADGIYALNHRSADLQKLKEFQDSEFEIIGYKQGTGSEEGCIIYQCTTENGATFFVRPRGSVSDRKEKFKNGDSLVSKMLTVRYQELTRDGIPRFPVGISVRDYE